jgi:hypothetical protein
MELRGVTAPNKNTHPVTPLRPRLVLVYLRVSEGVSQRVFGEAKTLKYSPSSKRVCGGMLFSEL